MPKNRYCEMCDRWFPSLRTVECPLCGDQTKPAPKSEGQDGSPLPPPPNKER